MNSDTANDRGERLPCTLAARGEKLISANIHRDPEKESELIDERKVRKQKRVDGEAKWEGEKNTGKKKKNSGFEIDISSSIDFARRERTPCRTDGKQGSLDTALRSVIMREV